ncbi:hypothetical protein EW146_g3178 [Bondarzewia mesenterica]|uniref:Deacetylase sirtuin-type domain-containing protein n=1 Tax=Bondarzewia mesenterica TaxID=1095465 RepID=A0A4S4LYL2_9AGAM|nr:hypothetical protein EW146_g3178 [Bondarzewia mesenterica]
MYVEPTCRQRDDLSVKANLARLNLPHPEAVFEMSFFREQPQPFYALAKELYPGHYRPTLSHTFVKLLAERNLLRMCFTQNIDTLERRAGVPEDKIIEAHGSFATQRCIECRKPFDSKMMRELVHSGKIPKCEDCGGLVKPDIVFFGESLPVAFGKAVPLLREADLLIVMGTSLTVHPFASLANRVNSDCPRVLINLERAGNIGSQIDDIVLLGQCDDIVRELCKELGWEEELTKEWEVTAASVLTDVEGLGEPGEIKHEKAEDVVDRLAVEISEALHINSQEGHEDKEGEIQIAETSDKAGVQGGNNGDNGESSTTPEQPHANLERLPEQKGTPRISCSPPI